MLYFFSFELLYLYQEFFIFIFFIGTYLSLLTIISFYGDIFCNFFECLDRLICLIGDEDKKFRHAELYNNDIVKSKSESKSEILVLAVTKKLLLNPIF